MKKKKGFLKEHQKINKFKSLMSLINSQKVPLKKNFAEKIGRNVILGSLRQDTEQESTERAVSTLRSKTTTTTADIPEKTAKMSKSKIQQNRSNRTKRARKTYKVESKNKFQSPSSQGGYSSSFEKLPKTSQIFSNIIETSPCSFLSNLKVNNANIHHLNCYQSRKSGQNESSIKSAINSFSQENVPVKKRVKSKKAQNPFKNPKKRKKPEVVGVKKWLKKGPSRTSYLKYIKAQSRSHSHSKKQLKSYEKFKRDKSQPRSRRDHSGLKTRLKEKLIVSHQNLKNMYEKTKNLLKTEEKKLNLSLNKSMNRSKVKMKSRRYDDKSSRKSKELKKFLKGNMNICQISKSRPDIEYHKYSSFFDFRDDSKLKKLKRNKKDTNFETKNRYKQKYTGIKRQGKSLDNKKTPIKISGINKNIHRKNMRNYLKKKSRKSKNFRFGSRDFSNKSKSSKILEQELNFGSVLKEEQSPINFLKTLELIKKKSKRKSDFKSIEKILNKSSKTFDKENLKILKELEEKAFSRITNVSKIDSIGSMKYFGSQEQQKRANLTPKNFRKIQLKNLEFGNSGRLGLSELKSSGDHTVFDSGRIELTDRERSDKKFTDFFQHRYLKSSNRGKPATANGRSQSKRTAFWRLNKNLNQTNW